VLRPYVERYRTPAHIDICQLLPVLSSFKPSFLSDDLVFASFCTCDRVTIYSFSARCGCSAACAYRQPCFLAETRKFLTPASPVLRPGFVLLLLLARFLHLPLAIYWALEHRKWRSMHGGSHSFHCLLQYRLLSPFMGRLILKLRARNQACGASRSISMRRLLLQTFQGRSLPVRWRIYKLCFSANEKHCASSVL